MSVKFKLSMVMLAVLATVGVAAYPLSIYIGKTIYEKELNKVLVTNRGVTLLSSEDGLTTKKDSFKYVHEGNDGRLSEFYFDVESEFGLTGVDSEIDLNFNQGTFAEVVSILKHEGLQEVPDIDLHIGYKIWGDKIYANASIDKAVISNPKYSCVSEGAKWNVSNSREASLGSYKTTTSMLLDGIASGKYNISIPLIECQATDDLYIGSIKNVNFNGVLAGKTVSVIDWKIDNIKVKAQEEKVDLELNDIYLKTELVKNDSNNTYGYGVQLVVKDSKVLATEIVEDNKHQAINITDFNYHNLLVNLTPRQIEDYVKMSLEFYPNIADYNFGTHADLILKDLSAKVNGNDLKVNGDVSVYLGNNPERVISESKGDINIKLSQKIIELFGGQQTVDNLVLFVEGGHINLENGIYSTKVSLKEGHIYLNDKRLF